MSGDQVQLPRSISNRLIIRSRRCDGSAAIATKRVPGSITTMVTVVFFSGNSPDVKIFIDGRMPAWRINDRRIFEDYMDLNREDSPKLAELDHYGVDWALIQRGSVLALVLESHPAWKTIYTDAKVVILRRQV